MMTSNTNKTKNSLSTENVESTKAQTTSTNVEADLNILNFNINSLRLPSNFGATLGVKKLLTTVPVSKPKKSHFFRVHKSTTMTFDAMLLEQKDTQETYLVVPAVAQYLTDLVKPFSLLVAIDRQNNIRLVPVPMPGEDGTRNPWHESLLNALHLAKDKWIRITANQQVGGYDVFQAEGSLEEPEWPEYSIDRIVEVAFRGKIITSLEHPIIQTLFGRV